MNLRPHIFPRLRRAALTLLCLLTIASHAYAWTGTVVKVHDGDTLHVQDEAGKLHKVRVYGIDCPELLQEYGPEAQAVTEQAVLGKSVNIVNVSKDKYKREVAGIVLVEDLLVLQDSLITQGLAWVDDRFCKIPACAVWRLHQQDAQQATPPRGLWQAPQAIAPWAWRRGERAVVPPLSLETPPPSPPAALERKRSLLHRMFSD